MSTISGKVESKSRNGTGIKVQGNWYNGSPSTLAAIEWKDMVTITVDGKNIISAQKDGGESAAPAASGGGGGGSSDSRQGVIVYQSSRKDAIQVSVALLEANIVPMPSAKAQKFDAFMAFVDELTDTYYTEAMDVFASGDLPQRNQGGE